MQASQRKARFSFGAVRRKIAGVRKKNVENTKNNVIDTNKDAAMNIPLEESSFHCTKASKRLNREINQMKKLIQDQISHSVEQDQLSSNSCHSQALRVHDNNSVEEIPSRRSSLCSSSLTARESSNSMRRSSGDTVQRQDESSSSSGEMKQIESYTNISNKNRRLKREVERMKKKVEADLEKQRSLEFANMHSVSFQENDTSFDPVLRRSDASLRNLGHVANKNENPKPTKLFEVNL